MARKINLGSTFNPNSDEYFEVPEQDIGKLRGNVLYAFTDGSCYPNPGPGGWGVRLIWNGTGKELFGGAPDQTNNTMELTAIQMALQARRSLNVEMRIYTDSKYCIGCLTQWHWGWKRNGWRTSKGEPVKNREIIEATTPLITDNVSFKWVKGHAGHVHNERVDELAGMGRKQYGGTK